MRCPECRVKPLKGFPSFSHTPDCPIGNGRSAAMLAHDAERASIALKMMRAMMSNVNVLVYSDGSNATQFVRGAFAYTDAFMKAEANERGEALPKPPLPLPDLEDVKRPAPEPASPRPP